jgi:hypothetical protein
MSRKIRLAPTGVEIHLNCNQLVSHPAGIGSSSWTGGRTLQTLQEERMDLAGRRPGLDVWLAW